MNCSSSAANGCFQWHGFPSTLWACSFSAQDVGKAHSLGLLLFTPCSHQQKNLSFKSGWFTLTPTNSTLHLPLLCTVSWKLLRDTAHGTGTWFHHERHCQEMEGGRKVRLGYVCPLAHSWSLQFGQVPRPKAMAPVRRPSPPASAPPLGSSDCPL